MAPFLRFGNRFFSPVFKKENRSFILNYYPISKISIILKIVSNSKWFLLFNNSLVNEQHGFRKGRFTVTYLAAIKQNIINSLLSHNQTDGIYIDFEKAFDRIDHGILILKLLKYGIHDPLLSWLS